MTDTPDTPTTDLAIAPDLGRGTLTTEPLSARIRYAQELSYAGDMLPRALWDNRTQSVNAGKVLLLCEMGQMLGIHPVAAINGVNVIEGKPSVSPALMTALVRRAGHKFRIAVTGTLEDGTIAATATVVRYDDPKHPFNATWTLADAERAELGKVTSRDDGSIYFRSRTQKGFAGSWEKYPRAMLKARATSEVCREAAEEALCGVHYTPEEMGAEVDEEGVQVTLDPNPPVRPQRQPEPEPVVPDLDALGRGLVDAMPKATDKADLAARVAAVDPTLAGRRPNGSWGFNTAALRSIDLPPDDQGTVMSAWDALVVFGGNLPDAPGDRATVPANVKGPATRIGPGHQDDADDQWLNPPPVDEPVDAEVVEP